MKTVGLLSAVGSVGDFKPTPDLLAFAGGPPKAVKEGLDSLVRRSFIVYRKHMHAYGLWQGSDIDLDAPVNEAKRRVSEQTIVARKLELLWTPAPLVAKRHSFLTGTLRYFTVRFADAESFSRALEPSSTADGILVYCLPSTRADHDALEALAQSSTARERLDVLIALPHDLQALREGIRDLELLHWVEQHTPELGGDAVARRELRARQDATQGRVGAELQRVFSPADLGAGTTWYHQGLPQRIESMRSLAHVVSDICDVVYRHTPLLRNELLNRRRLSSAASKARRLLIEAMVQHGELERLGITGTPPEMSMYYSVLGATGIQRQESTGYSFGPPSKDASLQEVWQAIETFFAACELQRRSVADLFRMLEERPFGLKQGIIPVLFCAAALAHDTEVALYENGAFLPELSVEVFERLLRSPERFDIRRYQVTGVSREVFRRFAELFGASPDERQQDVVAVMRPLFRFFNKLPPFTRQTKAVSATALRVRRIR